MRRSKRIAEKKLKIFKMPTRDQVLQNIPSTSKMNVRVQMPFKQVTRDFSRETHRYNQETTDDTFDDELSSSQESFISGNNSPSIHKSVEDKDYSSGISSQSSSNEDSSIVEENFDDMSQYDIEPLSQENVKKSQSTPQRQFDSSQKSEIFRPHKAKSKKRYRLCSDDDDDGKNATCSKNVKRRLFRRLKTPDEDDNVPFAGNEEDFYSDGTSFSENDDDEEGDESIARSSRILKAKLRKRNEYFELYGPLIEERKQKEARKLTKETNSQNKIEVYDSSSDDEDNKKQNIEPLYYEISRYYQKLEILFKRLTNRRLKSDDPNFVKVKGRFYDRPRFVAGELKIYDNNDIDFSDYDF